MGNKNSKVQEWKVKFNNAKLASKIAISVGALMSALLIAMVIISTIMANSALTKAIDGEVLGLAEQTGLEVQAAIDRAAASVQDIQNYLSVQYNEFYEKDGGKYSGEKVQSRIFSGKLEALNAELESYMLNTAWSVIEGSPFVSGVGFFFEPGAFDPNIKEYAFYVSSADAKNQTAMVVKYDEYSEKDYYKAGVERQEIFYTDAYVYEDAATITASYPFIYDGETQGCVIVDLNVAQFGTIDMTSDKYSTLYGNVIDREGIYVYDSAGVEWSGVDMAPYFYKQSEYEKMMQKMQGNETFKMVTSREDGRKVVRYCYPVQLPGAVWWSQSVLDQSDMNKDTTKLVLMMFALAVLTLAVIIVAMIKTIRKFLKPMEGVVDAAEKMAEGHFDIELQVTSEDEIGQLTAAFANTVERLRAVVSDLSRGLSEMANGNFDIAPAVDYPGELESIKNALGSFIVKISDTLSQINGSSDQVADSAKQIAAGAESLTEGATDQASSIEELQATVTEVSGAVERNAQSAEAANNMAREVGGEITAGNDQMQEMVQAMNLITETSQEINKIINTINDIASQTNLLSLNASIEAARAGEMGRGFAVVAAEVGNLANQSAEAAKNSTELIARSIRAVEEGKEIVDVTAEKLAQSVARTQELVAHIGQISSASIDQAEQLNQVTQAVEQIAAVVEENTAMAEESSASSEEMASQAQVLKDLIEQFNLRK